LRLPVLLILPHRLGHGLLAVIYHPMQSTDDPASGGLGADRI